MDRQLFEQMYQGQAPWDTGRPQPAIVKLAEAGQIRGSVLDVGCGTGENVLVLGSQRPRQLGPRLRAGWLSSGPRPKLPSEESTPISSSGTPWNWISSAGSSTP